MKMNIPNAISIFRIILIPLVVMSYSADFANHRIVAAALFLLAVVSDFLDGWLARKLNQITLLGRILDPLADKLMVFSVLIMLSVSQIVPRGVAIFFMVIELVLIIGAVILYSVVLDVPPSNIVGKTASVIFYLTLAFLMMFGDVNPITKIIMLGAAIVLTSTAFVLYAITAVKLYLKKIQETDK